MITIGLVQADIKPFNKKGNMAHYASWLESAIQEPVHLLVFPETFNCGFSPDIMDEAELDNGESTYFLYMTANKFQCDVVATAPILQNGRLYNRLVWFSRDRILGKYNKHHLFMGEEELFSSGNDKTIVNTLGYKFLPLICFDVRFPEWSRNHVRNGVFDYDCLVYTANFPAPRESELMALAKARAIENQSYAIVVNRVGSDPACAYDGGTAFIGPYGETLTAAPDGREAAIAGEIDLQHLADYHAKFPVLEDADAFKTL